MSRMAVIGAGPGGMATALAAHRVGYDVALYERYPEVKAAGNILNLWPPPQKVLGLIGVDVEDLGAPANATFRRSDGRVRALGSRGQIRSRSAIVRTRSTGHDRVADGGEEQMVPGRQRLFLTPRAGVVVLCPRKVSPASGS